MEHWEIVIRKKIEKTKGEFAIRYTYWKRFERIFVSGDFGNDECIIVESIDKALEEFDATRNPNSRHEYVKFNERLINEINLRRYNKQELIKF